MEEEVKEEPRKIFKIIKSKPKKPVSQIVFKKEKILDIKKVQGKSFIQNSNSPTEEEL